MRKQVSRFLPVRYLQINSTLMDFTVAVKGQSGSSNYTYAIQFLDKIYVCNQDEIHATVSNEDVSQFLSAELVNPSPLTIFNQIVNTQMQMLVLSRK